jgi:hypothetical protein
VDETDKVRLSEAGANGNGLSLLSANFTREKGQLQACGAGRATCWSMMESAPGLIYLKGKST